MVLNNLINVLDAYMIRGITFNMYIQNEEKNRKILFNDRYSMIFHNNKNEFEFFVFIFVQ